ncbi:MAG: PDZ domain-containing protein [Bacteroidetes bacterium]|jgi:carboxyl-terminal processing protease|nr:PDZ domain-containing protein [Bacteroidota bacterium]
MVKRQITLIALALIFMSNQLGPKPNNRYFEISKNLEIFAALYKELNHSYVDELDPGSLMRKAIDAMVESLDPYTVFYSESEIERYQLEKEGKYEGIGAKIIEIDGYLTIVQPYRDYSADDAGLKAGDQIIGIGGVSIEQIGKKKAELMLRGASGTGLQLRVRRPATGEELEVELFREQISLPNVPHKELVAPNLGYVNLSTFTQQAGNNVKKAIERLMQDNDGSLEGLILDLRQNGGGLLREAVNLTNLFIPKGEMVVSTRSKVEERDQLFRTKNKASFEDLPLVVLVDERSASASEIVSGALQDYDRAVIMGQRTFGKGLVQNVKKLNYNNRVKITTSRYYIPSGRSIQSAEYQDGKAINITDSVSKSNSYRTRAGRKVYGGGGVLPDVVLDPFQNEEILKALEAEHAIFKYVTDYVGEEVKVEDPRTYEFKDYDDFVEYVESDEIQLEFAAEKELGELRAVAEQYGYWEDIEKDIKKAESRIAEAKKSALSEYEDLIRNMIAEEIVSRFEYMEGRLIRKLQFDPEIDQAVRLLKNQDRYTQILSSK